MRLRDIEFGNVFNASGARNFFGDGYWFHHVWRPFGLDYADSTFIAKTTTLESRAGNMPLVHGTTEPVDLVPRCIVVKPFRGVVLNNVGLSGPGAEALLLDGQWQKRTEPFMISFMSVKSSVTERLEDLRGFVALLKSRLSSFRAPIALQMNFSCPNVGLHRNDLRDEAYEAIAIAHKLLPIPLIPKFGFMEKPDEIEDIVDVARHPACDAIALINTIPFGEFPHLIDWRRLFGSLESPLAAFGGGGGLSGTPLLPLMTRMVAMTRAAGITKPILAGGGILSRDDACLVISAGASAIELGCVSILRPWRVSGIIRFANERLLEKQRSKKAIVRSGMRGVRR